MNIRISLRLVDQILLCIAFILMACNSDTGPATIPDTDQPTDTISGAGQAIVVAVETSGEEGAYLFDVRIKSPDTGCDQYANWWEVISLDGRLIYRRILAHSHVNEQPFSRNGGPVKIMAADSVMVRGHMDPSGYSTQVYVGSIQNGFAASVSARDFANDLAKVEPQPNPCQF